MSYNGNGVFLINTPGQPVVSGTTITSTAFNALTTDLASGLTNAITKDGQTNITANIPMSNFKITGLGAATSSNDAVRLAQIQDGIINGRFVNLEYTGTFTGGTGVVNLGSGQFYKDASGNVGIGTASPTGKFNVVGGRSFFSAASEPFAVGARYVSTGGTFYFGASDGTATPDGVFCQAGGAERMRITDAGNVGIGTASPLARLNAQADNNNSDLGQLIVSGATNSNKRLSLGFNTTSNYGFVQSIIAGDNYYPLALQPTAGNVGIGTVSPTQKLHVVGAIIGQSTDNYFGNYSSGAYADIGSLGTSDVWLDARSDTLTNVPLQFRTKGTGEFVWTQGLSEKMRINSSGNVGIGTVSPAYTLDVQATTGTVSATSTTGTNFSKVQVNNTGGSFQLAIDNSAGTNYGSTVAYARCLWNDSVTAPTLFYTNFAERMRIDASGNVSIKVTSAIGRFNVQSDDSATAIAAGNVSGTAAYNGALFYNNGFTSLVGQISIAGATASYLSVSDYRLKESVAPMTGALATVAQLKPVTYKWKADGSDGQGFIAHELQAVVPDCVTGDKDAVDAEGKPQYQGVDTSFLVATLTAAIQEQQAIISAMETRLAALEA